VYLSPRFFLLSLCMESFKYPSHTTSHSCIKFPQ